MEENTSSAGAPEKIRIAVLDFPDSLGGNVTGLARFVAEEFDDAVVFNAAF